MPNGRVLVVEDGAILAMLIEAYLELLGYEIAACASRLPDALHKASTMDFDAAILDLNLAGELSFPVADVLRARDIPFVFATGYGRAGIPDSYKDSPVIAKPFGQEQLGSALRATFLAAGSRASAVLRQARLVS